MNKLLLGTALAAVASSAVYAGGIERTTQSALVLYKDGNYVELSHGQVTPTVSGEGLGIAAGGVAAGTDYDKVAKSYNQTGISAKIDLTDRLSFGLVLDSPFGADIEYDGASLTTELGGTSASAETKAQTFLLKYQFDDNFSGFGGIRRQTASGDITLDGIAYGGPTVVNRSGISLLDSQARSGASGYSVELGESTATGFVVGGAYERKDIALRVAVTYNSAIEHEMDTTEVLPVTAIVGLSGLTPITATINNTTTGTTKIKTPQSWNLEFQSGVAKDTLVFGSIRWVEHSTFKITPDFFKDNVSKDGLVDLEDTTTYRLGVGHRFTPNFSAQASIAHERASSDDFKSPLAPTNGYTGISIGGAYKFDGGLELAGGVTYLKLGDAKAATADTARADFSGNTAMGAGIRISYAF